jgi:hypothetical protein
MILDRGAEALEGIILRLIADDAPRFGNIQPLKAIVGDGLQYGKLYVFDFDAAFEEVA